MGKVGGLALAFVYSPCGGFRRKILAQLFRRRPNDFACDDHRQHHRSGVFHGEGAFPGEVAFFA